MIDRTGTIDNTGATMEGTDHRCIFVAAQSLKTAHLGSRTDHSPTHFRDPGGSGHPSKKNNFFEGKGLITKWSTTRGVFEASANFLRPKINQIFFDDKSSKTFRVSNFFRSEKSRLVMTSVQKVVFFSTPDFESGFVNDLYSLHRDLMFEVVRGFIQ